MSVNELEIDWNLIAIYISIIHNQNCIILTYFIFCSRYGENSFNFASKLCKFLKNSKNVIELSVNSHWNRYKTGQNHLTDFIGVEPSKKRKRRTSFTPQALELLNAHFERNTHPSGNNGSQMIQLYKYI